jgi:hypothetical protein
MALGIRLCGVIAMSLTLGAVANAADSPSFSESPMVICALRAGESWKEVARGKFSKRITDRRIDFALTAGDRSYDWWQIRNPDGSHTSSMPLSLAYTFVPEVQKPRPLTEPRGPIVVPRNEYPVPDRISSTGEGNIRETYGSLTVMSVIGTRCPR